MIFGDSVKMKKNQGKKIGLLNEVKKEITKRGLKDWLKDM